MPPPPLPHGCRGGKGRARQGGAGAAALTQPPAGTRRADTPATPPRGRRSRAAARRPLAAAPHTFAGDWPAGGREPRPPPRARARGRRRPSGERRTKRGKPGELRRHLGAASDPPVSDPGIPGDRDCWDRGSPRGWCGTGNPRARVGASYDRRYRGQEIGLGRRLEGLSRGGGLELLECAVGEPPAWGALRGAGRRGNPREGGKEGGKPPRTCWQRRSGAVQPLLPQCTTGCGHWHRQLHVPGGSDEGGGESRGGSRCHAGWAGGAAAGKRSGTAGRAGSRPRNPLPAGSPLRFPSPAAGGVGCGGADPSPAPARRDGSSRPGAFPPPALTAGRRRAPEAGAPRRELGERSARGGARSRFVQVPRPGPRPARTGPIGARCGSGRTNRRGRGRCAWGRPAGCAEVRVARAQQPGAGPAREPRPQP